MTGLVSDGHATPPAQLPVAIWPCAQMATFTDDLPKYLLAPEVSTLLHFMPDLRRKMLFTTLWTPARESKGLGLSAIQHSDIWLYKNMITYFRQCIPADAVLLPDRLLNSLAGRNNSSRALRSA